LKKTFVLFQRNDWRVLWSIQSQRKLTRFLLYFIWTPFIISISWIKQLRFNCIVIHHDSLCFWKWGRNCQRKYKEKENSSFLHIDIDWERVYWCQSKG
jgi:hypothetical protein